jgi:hypothetical protein
MKLRPLAIVGLRLRVLILGSDDLKGATGPINLIPAKSADLPFSRSGQQRHTKDVGYIATPGDALCRFFFFLLPIKPREQARQLFRRN